MPFRNWRPRSAAGGGSIRENYHILGGSGPALSRIAAGQGRPAGDVLVALDGLRVTPQALPQLLARYRPGDTATVHYFRRRELHAIVMTLQAPAKKNGHPRVAVTTCCARLTGPVRARVAALPNPIRRRSGWR